MPALETISIGGSTVTLHRMHQDTNIGALTLLGNIKARFGPGIVIDLTGNVNVHEYAVICDNVHIFTHKHDWNGSRELRRDHNLIVFWSLSIGRDVYIAQGTTIVGGTEIGEGAVIGACSVVTKSVPAFEIWAGNPARKIGER